MLDHFLSIGETLVGYELRCSPTRAIRPRRPPATSVRAANLSILVTISPIMSGTYQLSDALGHEHYPDADVDDKHDQRQYAAQWPLPEKLDGCNDRHRTTKPRSSASVDALV